MGTSETPHSFAPSISPFQFVEPSEEAEGELVHIIVNRTDALCVLPGGGVGDQRRSQDCWQFVFTFYDVATVDIH